MIKVGVDARSVKRAINSYFSVIRPVAVTHEGMKAAKKTVKTNYHKKWARHGYGGGYWTALKRQEGYLTAPGFFTGTTYRSIDSRFLGFGQGIGIGEVSVYGHWPGGAEAPGKSKRLEKEASTASFGTGGLDPRDVEDWEELDALNPWGGHDPEEVVLSRLAEERGEEAPDFNAKRKEAKPFSTDRSLGFIEVGPNGVTIQYANSAAMFKPRELMRTKRYGQDTKGRVDFISLDQNEIDDVADSVFETIRARLNHAG